jgi:hypothetical protein
VILARGQVALADAGGVLREQATGLLYLSVFALDDDPRGALRAAMESTDLARRAGLRGPEMTNLLNIAEISVLFGEPLAARDAISELRQRDLPPDHLMFLDCVEAMLKGLHGGIDEAWELLEPVAEQMSTNELITARTTYLRARSFVSLAAGDLPSAQREAAAAVAVDPLGINSPHALALQARAALWQRDANAAREALTAMKGFRGRWMGAVRLTTEAGLAALEDHAEPAVDSYQGAIEAWRSLDVTLDLALCELDLALLLGPDSPASSAAKEARDIFTQLGAAPYLERLNRVASRED